MLKFPPFTGASHYPKQSCKMCFYYSHGSLYFKLFPSSWALSSFPAQYSSSHSSTLPGQARKMSQKVSYLLHIQDSFFYQQTTYHLVCNLAIKKLKRNPLLPHRRFYYQPHLNGNGLLFNVYQYLHFILMTYD